MALLISGGWSAGDASAGINVWTSHGPEGVCPSAISINPADPDRLLVGTRSGEVFASTDGGESWHFSGLSDVGSIECFAIDRADLSVVYAASNRSGLFKSVDGGKHWTVALPLLTGDVVIAAGRPGTVFALANELFRSDDGGGTWRIVPATRPAESWLTAVAVDPVAEFTLYLGTRVGGVFKSTDGGETWVSASAGLPNGGAAYVTSLTLDPRHPGALFAGIYPTGGARGGLYRSTDGADTWTSLMTSNTEEGVSRPALGPEGSTTMYVVVSGVLFRSDDAGASWAEAGPQLPFEPPLGWRVGLAAVDPRDEKVLYLGIDVPQTCGSHLVKSTDGGATWVPLVHGLTNTTVEALAVDPSAPDTLYAAVTRVGLFRSADNGAGWTSLEGSPDCAFPEAVVVDPSDPATLFAACGDRGVVKSTDEGRSWVSMNQGLDNVTANALAIDPTRPLTVYAGSKKYWFWGSAHGSPLYKTTNGGSLWIPSTSGLPTPRGDYWVTKLAVEPRAPSRVYAGASDGLYRSTDGARNWSLTLRGYVTALAVDPNRVGTVYCGSGSPRVSVTTDAGAHWTSFETGHVGGVRALVVDPAAPSTVYSAGYGGFPVEGLGGNTGVSRSTDGGATWVPINGGLTNLNVFDLAIDRTGTKLHAATNGGGVFDLEISTATPEITVSPEDITIVRGGSAVLTASINPPQLEEVVLTLTSSDSARVSVPLTATLPAGEPAVQFSLLALASGGPFVISVRLPEALGGAVATAQMTVRTGDAPSPRRSTAGARRTPLQHPPR